MVKYWYRNKLIILIDVILISAFLYVAWNKVWDFRQSNSVVYEADFAQQNYLEKPPDLPDHYNLLKLGLVNQSKVSNKKELCVNDVSISVVKDRYSYEGAKQLSEIVKVTKRSSNRILCNDLENKILFSFPDYYSYRLGFQGVPTLFTDGSEIEVSVMSVNSEDQNLLNQYNDLNHEVYDYISDIFLLDDYGLGYYVEYKAPHLYKGDYPWVSVSVQLSSKYIINVRAIIDRPEVKSDVFEIIFSMIPIEKR